MNSARVRRTNVAVAVSSFAIALSAGHAFGAGFALQENSGSAMGNAFAGGAAAGEDASTVWSNPAGMSRLASPQVAMAVHLITPSFKFRDEGSMPAAFQPLGGTGGDAGSVNVVPNLYAVMPLNPQWAVGIGINAPYGLVTEYDDNWLGRFQAIKSDIKTINVNPSASWRVTDTFAVGVGVDWQRIDAELTSRVNYSAALAQAAGQAAAGGLIPPALVPQIVGLTPGLSSKVKVDGDDSTWGWNIGFLWDATPQTRIGAQYRSSIKYKVSGNVSFDNPGLPTLPAPVAPIVGLLATNVNAALPNGGVTADIKLPDIANLSVFHRLNERWDVMGDVQFTRWSVFKQLEFVRTTGAILANTPENFDDVWRFSVGATYHWSDAWTFRGGLAYDQSPVNTADRTVRLPDSDRIWLAVGAQYRFNRNLTLDAGYVYIPMRNADINQNAGSTAANGLVKGHYDSNVNIVSAQITYTFQ
ncbi:MAG TPA: outer membrane protein transport protein [Casimicrobiaceae bacterium]|nr:outer membrane protein transport protein [Casimicrobiaceae bacterium]